MTDPTPNSPDPKPVVLGTVADVIADFAQPSTQRMSENAEVYSDVPYRDAAMFVDQTCAHCLGQYQALYMHGSVCRYCFAGGH